MFPPSTYPLALLFAFVFGVLSVGQVTRLEVSLLSVI